MDRKIALIREYYQGLPKDRAKVETRRHGFAFLEGLLAGGATLEYGELTLTGLLHKYKLSHLSETMMSQLLRWHLSGECNVCLYFDDRANNLLCFNLDNNHKVNNTVVIPEMALAVEVLRDLLEDHGCRPLVLASGRGYHVWCRLDATVENGLIYTFMLRLAAKTVARLHAAGRDPSRIKFNLYPDRRIRDTVSLRLFGSLHAKNRLFSRVLTPAGLVDEEASWALFEEHLCRGTTGAGSFRAACTLLDGQFQGPGTARSFS